MNTPRRLEANVDGDFYVNTACINCDTCRQLAPDTFSEIGDYSAVTRQPVNQEEKQRAFYALLSCPTGAIGSKDVRGLGEARQLFPLPLTNGIYYCGFTSRKSFGGSSYFLVHPDGNWLIDSPRYFPFLVRKLEKMGGIRYIFLTHRDDVADADKYANHFSAERIIHRLEQSAQPDAEHIIDGMESVEWGKDFRIIPVPGHTRGHMVLLYRNEFLFTGDHLAWDREAGKLDAHKDYCWYSWSAQCDSMKRLLTERFEWILPGHGARVHLRFENMRKAMETLVWEMDK
ncbi:MBL fold metallo-hydrolase [Aneurinibacillus thermoaerophilus]|uniref:Glyoxylase, beta-lactamase superfamily II n=1 Tax=Aneurinibacillus thermoaerophilus TaxID=143495 RepID=A0A1G8ATT8_ANETH|nr:MBL fold metallo-hydrolase [Aneurinibacillus thermoaerophilus]MED0677044.1 MBL fold metallo-hydrolase [Aneurinibacillus thermoaerophilus]MED0680066.1 MBL fold metallo-hydrolase [Aneurinibacillus thermoaerophilus]MED0738176.1 MBL fold metallo-hydrolase [Aneurinibacillus thermoaerophilus]MED0758206.1 MBL fold metallo-hydrolase [Aneurinibacillus thermoaerophilus]MED0761360.1 MBL fold metallo-hydrolase [Aneurinibacillus thermoaerophilus]